MIDDTALTGFELTCMVDQAEALVEAVPLHDQLLLRFFSPGELSLEFGLYVGEFAAQVLDLSVLVLLYQLHFVLSCLDLPRHLCLVLFPVLHLGLEQLNLIFKVVHVDFHFMLQSDMPPHITLQLLDELFILARGSAHELRVAFHG